MSQHFDYNQTTISSGDTVRIHQEITEGAKKRIQIFEGIVIAIKNGGAGKSFTVRKIGTNGIGIEKIFPVMMPAIKQIELKRKGDVRRAKLYYLRDRIGKAATRIKEKSTDHTSAAQA
jgi:large subunit ribosomal protein L19